MTARRPGRVTVPATIPAVLLQRKQAEGTYRHAPELIGAEGAAQRMRHQSIHFRIATRRGYAAAGWSGST